MKRILPALLLSAAPAALGGELVEISAPIFPKTGVLYPAEGANFPATAADERALAANASLTFGSLLSECSALPQYSAITVEAPGGPALTSAQLDANYQQVAQCSYEQHTAKPYWIPRLVKDVDICEAQLGADWHLLTEADLSSFSTADFQFFQDTLTEAASAGGATFWGSFYFGLKVFLRAADGSIQAGDLSPAAAIRVSPLTFPNGQDDRYHYEGALSLRCIRRTTVP